MGELDFEYLQAGAWTLAEVTQVARAVDGMREVADAVALDVEVEPPAIAEARSAAYEYSAVPARSVAILGPLQAQAAAGARGRFAALCDWMRSNVTEDLNISTLHSGLPRSM